MKFYKYQGTGNDFIIVDNRNELFNYSNLAISKLCNRHFGIGADGFMLLENDEEGSDFYMRYFNADGGESTMCGNGGRCMAAFARYLGIGKNLLKFNSVDGLHTAEIVKQNNSSCTVRLKMIDVEQVHEDDSFYYLNTGSPHHVVFVDDLEHFDVVNFGKAIRYSDMYMPDGVNVNFVQLLSRSDSIFVRTYERGVENETLACGTGVTASAIATALFTESNQTDFEIKTLGGLLSVGFERMEGNVFRNIYLQGDATLVFTGDIEL